MIADTDGDELATIDGGCEGKLTHVTVSTCINRDRAVSDT